jgi:TrmH family RNA methyltransferase
MEQLNQSKERNGCVNGGECTNFSELRVCKNPFQPDASLQHASSAMVITSTDNPLVKRLAALRDTGGRQDAGVFVVEGRRAIDGLLTAGWTPELVLVREDLACPTGWPAVQLVGERVAGRISSAATPSGYVAVFPIPVGADVDPAVGGLVLAGVADPGNVGTLIRTAAAFAVPQVVVAGGADPFGPKVVQASAGALAAVRLHRFAGPEALAGGAPLCALVPRGGVGPELLPAGARWLVVGGEADGIPAAWLAACAERLTLPMPGAAVESLNAAVAGAVAMYALGRPR